MEESVIDVRVSESKSLATKKKQIYTHIYRLQQNIYSIKHLMANESFFQTKQSCVEVFLYLFLGRTHFSLDCVKYNSMLSPFVF